MDLEPRHKKAIFPSFSSDDIKLLVITFAGTVVANIVTVLFLGLAIATAHWSKIAHTALPLIPIIPVVIIASFIAAVSLLAPLWRQRNRQYKYIKGTRKKVVLITIAIATLGYGLILLLSLAGLAAGIK
jgi:hypothetical protein